MFNLNLAIKFGGSEISIYKKGVGLIAKEPAYLAVIENGKKVKVQAVGKPAEEMFYSKSNNITIYQPILNGAVQDEKMAVLLLSGIIKNAVEKKVLIQNLRALVCVPSGLNDEQLKLIRSVLHQSGILKVVFVTNGVSAYANLDTDKTMLIVDIGKHITDISVVNKSGISFGRTYFIGGETMDDSITTFIFDNHNLEVSNLSSEAIKNEIASLYDKDLFTTEYVGISTDNKFFKKHEITANEVRVAIKNVYDTILNKINEVISLQPKEVMAEIYSNGVMFVGGGSEIDGLFEYATSKLNMPVTILNQPTDSVIMGAGKLLSDEEFEKIKL